MDFVPSVFSFDQIDEPFQFSSIPCLQQAIQEDNLLVKPPQYNSHVTGKPDHSRRLRKSSVALDDIDDNPSEYKRKKIMHRDVERKRREEMAALNMSLRALLPLEYLKGKRSMCDHIHEAVNYIRHLQKRIEELGEKRGELERSLDQSNINVGSKFLQQESVTVETSRSGIQVIVSTALIGGVSLSRVLDFLVREGLNLVSSITTNVNERVFHTIESQVSDGRSINPSELQKKLTDLVG